MLDKISISDHSLVKKVEPVESVSRTKEVLADNQEPFRHQEQLKEKLEKMIDAMNEGLKASNKHVTYKFHEELNEYYAAIVDDSTNEVIKEIPPKKLLDFYAAMAHYNGLLVDKKG